MSSKLLVLNFFCCLGDEERSEQAKLGVGKSPPPFLCWAKCLFPGTDRSLRRCSEKLYHLLQEGLSSQKALKTVGDRAGDSSRIVCSHNFVFWPPASQIKLITARIVSTTLLRRK